MTRLVFVAAALCAGALLGATGSEATLAQATTLHARVGPSFTISLTTDAGVRVTKLDPGAYVIQVEDLAAEHNFHLKGPGVDRSTGIGESGTETWTVTFTDGIYAFMCDPHSGTMRGSFTVGTPPSNPTGPAATKKLLLTSGPGFTITLKTAAGKAARSVRLGTYSVVVRDRSNLHNAHIVAPGHNRRTTVGFVGTRTWKLKLARVGTLRFLCDPHAAQGMRGSAKITR